MAHAASQLKKNRGEVDVNALEDEKEKRRKSRRTSSREQKRKVTAEGRLAAGGFICPAVLASLEHDSVCVCVCVRLYILTSLKKRILLLHMSEPQRSLETCLDFFPSCRLKT